MRGTNKAVLDVLADSGGKEYWFLRHETDLRSEPLQVQVTNIQAIEAYISCERVIESFDKSDYGGFSGSRGADERCCLACREGEPEVFDDLDVWARRVIEIDILKGDFADDFARFDTFFAGGIDGRNTIDGRKELCGCTTSRSDSYEREG